MRRRRAHPHPAALVRALVLVAAVLASLTAAAGSAAHATAVAAPAAPPASIGVDGDGTSWYRSEPGLSPQAVTGGGFGQLFASQLTGDIQGQPLVAGGTLLVSTEADMAYGLDPATGAVRWSRSLGAPWNSALIGCNDLPSVGVTATAVVDAARGVEYLTSKVFATGTAGPAAYWMHALSVATGAEQPGFPVRIAGVAANDAHQSFDASYQLQRPGLVITGGTVYAAFGSHCDLSPTHGWVIGVRQDGSIATMWSDEAGVDNGTGLAGIWAPGALRVAAPGQLVLTTGNGVTPAQPTPGDQPPAQLGEAVVRLVVQPDGSLRPTDFFAPFDAGYLNTIDGDLGSASPVLLPAQFSTPEYPHLAVQIGKEGYLYVLDADHLGGFRQGASGGDDVITRVGPIAAVWGSPAVWGGDGGYLYILTDDASYEPSAGSGHLLALRFAVDGAGKPTFSVAGQSADSFGYGSTSPVVTSSGTTAGTGLVWVKWVANPGDLYGQLRAYDPVPDGSGTLQEVWSAPAGSAVNLTEPGVGGGRMYVGGRSGLLRGFGRAGAVQLTGGAVEFPASAVGRSLDARATFTARGPVDVTGVAVTGAAFSLGHGAPVISPSSPVHLDPRVPGEATLVLPLAFAPASAGEASGTVTLSTSSGPYAAGIDGLALSPTAALSVAPAAISFEGTTIGDAISQVVVLSNGGARPLRFSGASLPGAPFAASGLPAGGSLLRPGASVAVTIEFSPTAAGDFIDALTLSSDVGGSATLHLSGSAGTPAVLTVSSPIVDFGGVALGTTAESTFTVSDTGGTALAIEVSTPPGPGPFAAVTPLPVGTVLQAGDSVAVTVSFAPTAAGTASASWLLYGSGDSVLTSVALTGDGDASVGPPSAGGWGLLGDASVTGPDLTLDRATTFSSGSAVSPAPIATDGLTVAFDATIGGGTGADGMTLTFADPSSPTLLGQAGGCLGYCTISGVAVGLVTFQGPGDPSSNFVGIAAGGPVSGDPAWVATSSTVAPLQGATTHVVVSISGTEVTVSVGGHEVLHQSVPALPPLADLVFTGATGGVTDVHSVSNVAIG